jgi:hypothetical protein
MPRTKVLAHVEKTINMSAMPISWHEGCLIAFRNSLERKQETLANLTRDVARMEEEVKFRESQIARAKALKKDCFDAERFMKSSGTVK